MNAATPAHAVAMRGVSKSFGGVKALVDVDFAVDRGEIHALLGGNGAGKSTILKILNGVHIPDAGTIEVDGVPLAEHTPEAARRAGIAMIFQEMSLIPTLTVAQNVFLTREAKGPLGLIDDSAAERRAKELFDMLEVEVDPRALVGDLGAGQRQLTEIAKAISQDAKVLVLDEPSTALSVSDVERLFTFLRKLKAEGHAVIYVSHRMDEIARIADRATILRDGRHVITAPLSELPVETMIGHIVGRRSRGLSDVVRGETPIGEPLLELENVSGAVKPRNVSLVVRRGEVVGLAGLLGSGRSSLARVISGIDPVVEGEIRVAGKSVRIASPKDAIDSGMALIPEDRLRQGVIAEHSVLSNVTLAMLDRLAGGVLLSNEKARTLTDEQIAALRIKTASRDSAVRTLSGGNQQKVVIGKMLATNPSVVLLDEPSRGIDIGAKSEVFKLLAEGARRGLAVIYSTSEVGECLSVAHRIIVMSKGKISAEFGPDVTKEKIMAASGEVDLEHQLADAYGLDLCRVVTDLHQDELPLAALGVAGSKFLADEISRKQKMLIGVSHGRTLLACVENIPTEPVPGLRVVALMGGLTRKSNANPHEIVSRLAERTGAEATVMPVPFMANSAEDRDVLLGQKDVAEACELATACDVMLVGIGTATAEAELAITGMIDPAEMAAIARAGGVGETLGHFFDNRGRPVVNEVTQRIVTQPVEKLRNQRIVAVAGGAVKVAAIRAVLASGLLSGLITDERTARAIVERRDQDGGNTQRAPEMANQR